MGRCPHRRHATGPSRPDRPFPRRGGAGPSRPGGPFPVPVAWRRLGLGLGDRRREVAQVAARWATFDCYGTLIDWEGGISGAFAELWPDADPLALLRAYHRIEPEVQRGRAISYRQVLGETLAGVAAEAGSYKPAHGHWRFFFDQAGADRDHHVHVAASLTHDIAPCAELGLTAVWINRPGDATDRSDELLNLPRAAELPDLAALPDTLDRLRQPAS